MPLVKLHWWSRWKRVDGWGDLEDIKIHYGCDTFDKSKRNLSRFLEKYLADKVKNTRDIKVTINIVDDAKDNVQ